MTKSYTVEVQTGNRSHAGTDANVYLQLLGGKRNSPEIKLDTPNNDFEKGHRDTFTTPMIDDVGWINQIRIFHDNSGDDPG